MENTYLENYNIKIQARRLALIRAFWINLVLIAVIWLLTFVPGVIFLGVVMTGLSATTMHIAIIGALGLWGVFDLAFFLVPALAMQRI